MLYPCSFGVIAHRDLRQEYDISNTSTGYVLSAKCTEILIHVSRLTAAAQHSQGGEGAHRKLPPYGFKSFFTNTM